MNGLLIKVLLALLSLSHHKFLVVPDIHATAQSLKTRAHALSLEIVDVRVLQGVVAMDGVDGGGVVGDEDAQGVAVGADRHNEIGAQTLQLVVVVLVVLRLLKLVAGGDEEVGAADGERCRAIGAHHAVAVVGHGLCLRVREGDVAEGGVRHVVCRVQQIGLARLNLFRLGKLQCLAVFVHARELAQFAVCAKDGCQHRLGNVERHAEGIPAAALEGAG